MPSMRNLVYLVYVYLRGGDLNSMKQIHIKLPATLHRRLKVQAALLDETIQSYVVEALERTVAASESLSSRGEREEDK